MAFVQQLECDQIEEPSILWKLPLLLLASFVRQSDQQLGDLAQLVVHNNNTTASYNSTIQKWEPSLATIEEEENPTTTTPSETEECKRTHTALWQTALFKSADMVLSSKQQRAILETFASCCSPFFPLGLW